MVREDTGGRIDLNGVDLLRRMVSDVLDIHPALGRRDHRNPTRLPIHQQRQIKLLLDVGALFDIKPLHKTAMGACLVGDQDPAEHFGGVGAHILHRLDHADTAFGVWTQPLEPALAAPASVNLALHHIDRAAKLFRRRGRLIGAEGCKASRHGRAKFLKDGLGLVFVDIHEVRAVWGR